MTNLPHLYRGQMLELRGDGVAYEMENGDVLLIALCNGIDQIQLGEDVARRLAVAQAFSRLPEGYGEPIPYDDWVNVLPSGYFGYARAFIAKKIKE